MEHWLKENWFKSGVLFVVIFSGASITYNYFYSIPKKNDLELQAMCYKNAEEYFYKSNGMTFEPHYNHKLNKCFVLIGKESQSSTTNNIYKSESLDDVYENRSWGSWEEIFKMKTASTTFSCEVEGVKCNAKEDFNKLIIPYMKE